MIGGRGECGDSDESLRIEVRVSKSHCVDSRELNRFKFLASGPEHSPWLVPRSSAELDGTDSGLPPCPHP